MKYRTVSGTSLAVAVIALAMNGASVTPASAKKAARVECLGINACKGTSACKTASLHCQKCKCWSIPIEEENCEKFFCTDAMVL